MSAPFAALTQNAAAIRLAELGALLHNVGKLLPDFQRVMGPPKIYGDYDYLMIAGRTPLWDAPDGPKHQSERSVTAWRNATSDDGQFFQRGIALPGVLSHSIPIVAVGDLVEFHTFQPRGYLCFLMSLAHMHASGMSKRTLEREVDQSGNQVDR